MRQSCDGDDAVPQREANKPLPRGRSAAAAHSTEPRVLIRLVSIFHEDVILTEYSCRSEQRQTERRVNTVAKRSTSQASNIVLSSPVPREGILEDRHLNVQSIAFAGAPCDCRICKRTQILARAEVTASLTDRGEGNPRDLEEGCSGGQQRSADRMAQSYANVVRAAPGIFSSQETRQHTRAVDFQRPLFSRFGFSPPSSMVSSIDERLMGGEPSE